MKPATTQAQQVLDIAIHSIRAKVLADLDWEPDLTKDWLKQPAGVFTTIYQLNPDQSREFRGCIGIPQPEYPLGQAIAISARRAATEDLRFPPLSPADLDRIALSVEILSELVPLPYTTLEELYDQIELGVTGLVVRYNNYSALFLPRIPVEQQWNKQEYVEFLCRKALISPGLLGTEPLHFLGFHTRYFPKL